MNAKPTLLAGLIASVALICFCLPTFAQDVPPPDNRSKAEKLADKKYDKCHKGCNDASSKCGDDAVKKGLGQDGVNACTPAYNACLKRCQALLPPLEE